MYWGLLKLERELLDDKVWAKASISVKAVDVGRDVGLAVGWEVGFRVGDREVVGRRLGLAVVLADSDGAAENEGA